MRAFSLQFITDTYLQDIQGRSASQVAIVVGILKTRIGPRDTIGKFGILAFIRVIIVTVFITIVVVIVIVITSTMITPATARPSPVTQTLKIIVRVDRDGSARLGRR
jgi:hypothetical protein